MAIYPTHGVVKIVSKEVREFSDTKRNFYILEVIDSDVTVMVPIDNAETVGLRPLIAKTEIPKVYKILKANFKKNTPANGGQSWNKRYRDYADKLKSGDIFLVAEVLKEINVLQKGKELSFGEKRIMDSARTLLVKEISLSTSTDEDKLNSKIDTLLSS